jgi:hypothetical protein
MLGVIAVLQRSGKSSAHNEWMTLLVLTTQGPGEVIYQQRTKQILIYSYFHSQQFCLFITAFGSIERYMECVHECMCVYMHNACIHIHICMQKYTNLYPQNTYSHICTRT